MENAAKLTHGAQTETYSKTRVGFPHSPHTKFLACCSDCADSSGPRGPAVIFPQAKQSRSTVLLDSGVLSEPPKIPLIMDQMDPILRSSLFKRSTSCCAVPELVLNSGTVLYPNTASDWACSHLHVPQATRQAAVDRSPMLKHSSKC